MSYENNRSRAEDRIYASGGDPTLAVEDRCYLLDGEARVEGGEPFRGRRRRVRIEEGEGRRELDCVDVLRILSGERR